jgi:hypothetical protein
MNRKILIVTGSFFPDESPRSYRATELAKEFVRQGNSVTIISPEKNGIESFLKEWGIEHISLGTRKWKNIDFKTKNSILFKLERILIRFFSLVFLFPEIELFFRLKSKLKKVSGFDLLISIAVPYPNHMGVASVWKINNPNKNPAKVWIADCGDPFFGQENDTFQLPFYWAWVEKWFMKKPNFITVPTETSYLGYFPEFHHKIRVIPQGFKFEEYEFNQKPNKNLTPTFAYAGIFIPGRRDPTHLCEYLLNTKKDFKFHIFTRNSATVDKFIKLAPDKFILHDFIPRMKLLEKLQNEVDFVVNIGNIGIKQTPSKLIDYMLIAKPILPIISFDIDKQNIDRFLLGDYSGALIIENQEKYRIENVVAEFLKLF